MKFKVLEKAEKAIKKLNTEDPKLVAEVIKRLDFLQHREFNRLDIEQIKRKNGKYKIQEIRIFHPGSLRVFFVEIFEAEGCTYIIDCRKKKKDRFDSEYFRNLDKYLENELR